MEPEKPTTNRTLRLAILGAVLVLVTLALVSPADASARRSCRQSWGSQAKQLGNNSPGFPPTLLTGVRTGRNVCFDRLIFDLAGPAIGYRVEYVAQVTADGSGDPIPLRGGAFLQIGLATAAYGDAGQPTYQPADASNIVDVRRFTTFRQVALDGTFEGITTLGLGVRARLPFRVFVLPGPGSASRVIIDVSHRWA